MEFLHTLPYKHLTTLGAWEAEWPDYLSQYGFNATHIPQLIQIATHRPYLLLEEEFDAYWLPVHAWRILAQLRAEAAIRPLLDQLDSLEAVCHHFAMEEIPTVLARIGKASLRPVAIYLADKRHSLWSHIVVIATLSAFAKWQPELTDYCALIASTQLASFATQAPDYNSFLIRQLVELKAVQYIDVINAAFRADMVDLSSGDWQHVHLELGLLDERLTPAPPWGLISNQSDLLEWRQLAATAYEGEDTLSRFLREYARRERLGNVN